MDSGTLNLLDILTERVQTLVDDGQWEEAYRAADAAVEKARRSLNGHDESSVLSLISSLEIKGDLLRQMGHLEDARLVYLEAMEELSALESSSEMMARLNASVGVIYDLAENDEEAIRFYERAVALHERQEFPNLLEIADITNNLGYIYRSLGDYDKAETLFLKALEICHNEVGDKHEKTATIFNNLGALYLKTGYDEQAYEMHRMALEIRLELFGKDHTETAQSYANLALALARMSQIKQSLECFDTAIHIYEHHLRQEPEEYAAVVDNYVEYLNAYGYFKEAEHARKRADKKLSKLKIAV
ncbi:hypothetical protein Rhal01_01977 [Rubritalea halochordaticola]|uniref:Tetratricopeptide repeat protein n=1 Tax=Rubritalea halochordaticola TaxID=714537 RepID=A0ABP9UZE2_9BACT